MTGLWMFLAIMSATLIQGYSIKPHVDLYLRFKKKKPGNRGIGISATDTDHVRYAIHNS